MKVSQIQWFLFYSLQNSQNMLLSSSGKSWLDCTIPAPKTVYWISLTLLEVYYRRGMILYGGKKKISRNILQLLLESIRFFFNVIYAIVCQECLSRFHIEQTGWTLCKRINGHKFVHGSQNKDKVVREHFNLSGHYNRHQSGCFGKVGL